MPNKLHSRLRIHANTFWQLLSLSLVAIAAEAEVVSVSLNHLDVEIDERTGGIVSLSSPYSGTILQAEPAAAGLLDVAFPVESFIPMRLASRFSRAVVASREDKVVISWEMLGASRQGLALPNGAVSAEVTIEAADDGRSIIFRSRIKNESAAPIPQVLFPDLSGLKPFAGAADTRIRFGRGIVTPFKDPIKPPERASFYGHRLEWRQYPAGGAYNVNSLRWLDYGGFQGGLSVFQKKWGTYDWPNVITRRTERDPMSLRMAWEHTQTIEPGQVWDSGEFWLTPHVGGWAKGIEVYRDYVTKINPPRSLPKHVEEGLAYQTIWMIQTMEVDPAKAVFRYDDLPRVAEDALRHGIHEVVAWGWNIYSTLPIPIRSELGTVQDLIEGVRKARDMGVNITPFISVSLVRNQYAKRYGMEPSDEDYTYHYELIPQFTPYYTDFWNGVEINSNNKIWQKDVFDSLSEWINRGVTSFAWDVYRLHPNEEPDKGAPLLGLTKRIRKLARTKYPDSTFAGESATHLELDSRALDYLWNWIDYEDAAPITSLLTTPRVSCNVEDSALVVAKCLADNLYINVMPRQLDAPNGTALISDEPELAAALLQATKLRKQFLQFFVDGTFIGDSVLSQPANAFVRGYQLGDRLLVIVLNDRAQAQLVSIESDLGLWLPGAKVYHVTAYDSAGKTLRSSDVQKSHWFRATKQLEPGQLSIFEIASK